MTSRRRRDYSRPWRLYRDSEKGILMGVCAGIAEFFDVEVLMVRLITLLSLLIFTMPTLLVYFLLAWLLKDKPLSFYGPEEEFAKEKEFWRRNARRRYRY